MVLASTVVAFKKILIINAFFMKYTLYGCSRLYSSLHTVKAFIYL